MAETKIKPLVMMKSGHCATAHLTSHPDEAHARCTMGKCSCPCHFQDLDQYDCGCGGTLVETGIENPDPTDIDDEGHLYPVYLHVRVDEEGTVVAIYRQECP